MSRPDPPSDPPGLRALLKRLERSGVHGLRALSPQLFALLSAHTFAALRPTLQARIRRALSIVPALQRSLRAGLFDELSWPAFEEAARHLQRTAGPRIAQSGSLQHPILQSGEQVIVFEGARVLTRYTLPAEARTLHSLRYLRDQPHSAQPGDLHVVYTAHTRGLSQRKQLWMRSPHRPTLAPTASPQPWVVWDLPAAEWAASTPPPGDFSPSGASSVPQPPDPHPTLAPPPGDLHPSSQAQRSTEAALWPAPLCAWATQQRTSPKLIRAQLGLAPPGAERSPLGCARQLIGGWQCAQGRGKNRRWTFMRPDGQHNPLASAERIDALLTLPAATTPTALKVHPGAFIDTPDGFQLLEETGQTTLRYGPGWLEPSAWPLRPRLEWLHFTQPRDAALSLKLRQLDEAQAHHLLRAAAHDRPWLTPHPHRPDTWADTDRPAPERWPHTVAALQTTLGAGETQLMAALAQVVHEARALELVLAPQLQALQGAPAAPAHDDLSWQAHLPVPLGWTQRGASMIQDYPQILAVLAGLQPVESTTLHAAGLPWWAHWAALPRAVAFWLTRFWRPEESRAHDRAWLRAYLALPAPLWGHTLCSALVEGPLPALISAGGSTSTAPDGAKDRDRGGARRAAPSVGGRGFTTGARGTLAFVEVLRIDSPPGAAPSGRYWWVTLSPRQVAPQWPQARSLNQQVVPLCDERPFLRAVLDRFDHLGAVEDVLWGERTRAQLGALAQQTGLTEAALRWLWAGLPHLNALHLDGGMRVILGRLMLPLSALQEAERAWRARFERGDAWHLFAALTKVRSAEDLWFPELGLEAMRHALLTTE